MAGIRASNSNKALGEIGNEMERKAAKDRESK